jgi:murein DD-endopeptidase MepM/ murein hydrolase activator NlpD
MRTELENILVKNRPDFHPVVDFDPGTEKLFHFDFTSANTELKAFDIGDTNSFSQYINDKLQSTGSKYGIGGYNEDRVLYRRSELFNGSENRTIHLGIDIWGAAGTPIYTALGGVVHSFAFNDNFGDYGATIILLHQLGTITFHTLYGHLSLDDIAQLSEGSYIARGQIVGHFGKPEENGNWPAHLHFQVIRDMRIMKGDYPGVCTLSERKKYLANCPDPDLILDLMKYI